MALRRPRVRISLGPLKKQPLGCFFIPTLPRGRVRAEGERANGIEKACPACRQEAPHSSHLSGSKKHYDKPAFYSHPPSGEGPRSGGEGQRDGRRSMALRRPVPPAGKRLRTVRISLGPRNTTTSQLSIPTLPRGRVRTAGERGREARTWAVMIKSTHQAIWDHLCPIITPSRT